MEHPINPDRIKYSNARGNDNVYFTEERKKVRKQERKEAEKREAIKQVVNGHLSQVNNFTRRGINDEIKGYLGKENGGILNRKPSKGGRKPSKGGRKTRKVRKSRKLKKKSTKSRKHKKTYRRI